MELQVIGDRAVKKLAFSHIVHSIRRMNQKHKDEAKNRKLQNILFTLVQVCNISHLICLVLPGVIIWWVSIHLKVPFPTSSSYYPVSQGEEESRAKRAFTILCDLHRRRVWFDDRTANAICNACFHPSSRYMLPRKTRCFMFVGSCLKYCILHVGL
jgi:protein SDA1